MAIRDFTLNTVIERNARLYAGRTAFVFEGQTVTHAQYHWRGPALAAGLRAAGLAPANACRSDRPEPPEFLDALWRRRAAGRDRRAGELAPDRRRAGARDHRHRADAAAGRPAYQATTAALVPHCPSITGCYGFDAAGEGFLPYEDLLRSGSDGPAPAVDVSSDDGGFVIVHTAAVGGNPRGALLSHRGLLTGEPCS
jgi:long-chain acyl-CoA synthetase